MSQFTSSIAIGPEFFVKAKNDYSDWRWAVAREFMQNCIDAPGADTVSVTVALSDGNTVLTVANNGAPMTHDILAGKLLSLGGTGKGFQGTVGGFGKAKEVLYFCHEQYTIHTGRLLVVGSGAGYNLTEEEGDGLDGTSSKVVIQGNHVEALTRQFKRFAALAQWDGEITVNHEQQPCKLKKGARRKELPWCVIYTNKSMDGLLVARINGIPMFSKPVQYKGMVILELTGPSGDVLTANRDGLRWEPQEELDGFLATVATHARKAFKDEKKVEKRTYQGYKLAGKVVASAAKKMKALGNLDGLEVELVKPAEVVYGGGQSGEGVSAGETTTQAVEMLCRIAETTNKTQAADAPVLSVQQVQLVFRPEFHLRSEIGGKIPDWFLPGTFSSNSKRLISNWIGVLVELASLTKSDKPFSVGFVFDPDVEGMHEREGGQHVLYIAPAEIVQKEGKPRQLKARWSFNAEGNWKLLSVAIHEFVHFEGYSYHDEAYAGRLTDLFALVLANRTRFSRHFSAPVCWPE